MIQKIANIKAVKEKSLARVDEEICTLKDAAPAEVVPEKE